MPVPHVSVKRKQHPQFKYSACIPGRTRSVKIQKTPHLTPTPTPPPITITATATTPFPYLHRLFPCHCSKKTASAVQILGMYSKTSNVEIQKTPHQSPSLPLPLHPSPFPSPPPPPPPPTMPVPHVTVQRKQHPQFKYSACTRRVEIQKTPPPPPPPHQSPVTIIIPSFTSTSPPPPAFPFRIFCDGY